MAKVLRGVVSSKSGAKSIVITVVSRKTHPIYKKSYGISTKFMAHDENGDAEVGDTVTVVESRPISKLKRFKLLKIVKRPIIREKDRVDTLQTPADDLHKKVKTAQQPKVVEEEPVVEAKS